MTSLFRSRFRAMLGAIKCVLITVVIGQSFIVSAAAAEIELTTSQTSPLTKTQSVDDDSVRLTLNELKATGAQHSSYRRHNTREVTSEPPQSNRVAFEEHILPLLEKACAQCHGPEKREGNIRIDTLDPDLLRGSDVSWWLEVVAVLTNGDMPPPGETTFSAEDRGTVIDWLTSEIQIAATVRREEKGHSSFRRMTGYEYNYALQDLLGIPATFSADLPPESASQDGFQNSSDFLHMSAVQFATYRDLGLRALQKATVQGHRPPLIHWGISMQAAAAADWLKQDDELKAIELKHADNAELQQQELQKKAAAFLTPPRGPHYRNLTTGRTAPVSWDYGGAKYAWLPMQTLPEVPANGEQAAIIPPQGKLIVELGDSLPDQGTLRIRVRASGVSAENKGRPSLQLGFGWQASNDSQASVRISSHDLEIDATPSHPQFSQWDIPLSEVHPRNSVRGVTAMGDLPSPSEYITLTNSSVSQGDIQIDYVEVTAPVYEHWPTESHRRIFFDSAHKGDESVYAREVIARFASRAWRRPASDAEVDQKLTLLNTIRPDCRSFEEAVIEVLATVLTSPHFLYLVRSDEVRNETNGSTTLRLSDYELATRLAIFLWCSAPDDILLDLAATGRLGDRDILAGQVARMVADPRSRRFSKHFVRQWLGLEQLDYLHVDRIAYPQFDATLKEAMQQEPIAFFEELLANNHSVIDFLHADYTMANERLALHYGLKNVFGNTFRRVALDPSHYRGGLTTQAGLLAMNSDGKDSHPLKRGIWILKALLNAPPPPPPPAVPIIDLADPEIARLTLKQRMENHRSQTACKSCHSKIDPWGIALENFDAVGTWRVDIAGVPVDASAVLFNSQAIQGIDGLKRHLLEHRQDQFARGFVEKMATFALGRPLTIADRPAVEEITARLRIEDDGLATLITLIATSDLFCSP